jgi:serine/arginine repetitive matrix protein 2
MKMRNTLSLLSRSQTVTTPPQAGQHIPSIRLISATPSATGFSSEASTSFNRSLEESWASVPVPLAPKPDVQPRKRLVPKKSKLSILTMGRDKEKNRGKDLSDVVRRVGADSFYAKNGFEIFVDPTDDPDIGEIVMVKKKKSRLALDGMAWGPLDEVTNVPKVPPKDAAPLPKVKNEEKEKWWTLGRGRKDSKEKTKDSKENKMSSKRESSLMNSLFISVLTIVSQL